MRKLSLALASALALTFFVGTTSRADDVNIDDVAADDFDASPVVPEPSAALAMGAGLATIAFALRRRR